jgi:hypothetical protein
MRPFAGVPQVLHFQAGQLAQQAGRRAGGTAARTGQRLAGRCGPTLRAHAQPVVWPIGEGPCSASVLDRAQTEILNLMKTGVRPVPVTAAVHACAHASLTRLRGSPPRCRQLPALGLHAFLRQILQRGPAERGGGGALAACGPTLPHAAAAAAVQQEMVRDAFVNVEVGSRASLSKRCASVSSRLLLGGDRCAQACLPSQRLYRSLHLMSSPKAAPARALCFVAIRCSCY